MSGSTNLLFVGLPKSGKTTYLAALWHVLEDQSSTTKLKLDSLSGDRTYLNLIAEAWRACAPVPRTTLQTEDTTVTLHLNGDGLGTFTLLIPDLGGETFDQQVEQRRMSATHADLLRLSDGVILFVHPDVTKGPQISEQDQITSSIGGATEEDDISEGHALSPLPWKVEMLPTQAKLVELLQFLLELTRQRLHVALVVSAWDLVEGDVSSPHQYISGRMPLLRQFLDANDDLIDHTVFGISAQGGAIPDDKSRLQLLDPLQRIKVCYGGDNDHDITKPIAWLLGGR